MVGLPRELPADGEDAVAEGHRRGDLVGVDVAPRLSNLEGRDHLGRAASGNPEEVDSVLAGAAPSFAEVQRHGRGRAAELVGEVGVA
jgi:hypothetical protein